MSEPGGDPSSGISSEDVLIPTERHPACRQREARSGSGTERENLAGDAKGKGASGSNREAESTDAPERNLVPTLPQRSPPWLLTTAACGGLRSTPDCRNSKDPPSSLVQLRIAVWTGVTRDTKPRFVATTGQSAPLRRIGTFGLAVGTTCAFSLGIAGQVLTFRPRA